MDIATDVQPAPSCAHAQLRLFCKANTQPFNRSVMKTKLVAGLAAGTVLLIAVAGYIVWDATTRTPQALFASGKKYFDEKKYSEAAIQFSNAIRKEPRHRDSRYYLALSYLNLQNPGLALRQLQTLAEYYPDDTPANQKIGELDLSLGRSNADYYRQAQDIAKNILTREPQNVSALVLAGDAAAGLRDDKTAREQLLKAASLDPRNTAALISLGGLEARQKNYPEAEQAFLKAREADPKDKGVLISFVNYYRAVREPGKAESILKSAISQYPADKDIYLLAADFYSQSGRVKDVEDVLRSAQTANATDLTPSLVLADFYQAGNHPADARKLLLDLKSKFPANFELATKLATNLMADQPEQARKEIDQLLNAQPKNPLGYVLLGELQFRAGQFDAAEATLGKDPALNSRFPQVHFFLGNLAIRKGQIDQAQDHYQKSLSVNNAYLPARLALAELFMNRGKLADSRVEVEKVLKAAPGNVSARLLKTNLDMSEKKYSEVEQELTELAKDQPENAIIQRQLGLYYVSRNKNAEAEKSLARAFQIAPNSEEHFRNLILFYLRTKQIERAVSTLNSVPEDQQQAFHFELAGMVAAQANKLHDSETAYKKAIEKDPNRANAKMLLFNQYVQNGRMDDAQKMLDDELKRNPSANSVYAMKGTLFESQGKIEEAKQNYIRALQGDPNLDLAANNLAYTLAQEGQQLDTALEWAQGARNRHPEDPSIADTLGWVYYKLGSAVLAREMAQFAVSKQPDNPVFQYHLGLIYKANNQRSDAENALKKSIGSTKDFKEKNLAQAALKDIDHWRHMVTP
jgi:tetratricopeptide (TPR) repeat protein